VVSSRTFAGESFEVRIGLEVGDVVAGLIGTGLSGDSGGEIDDAKLESWTLPATGDAKQKLCNTGTFDILGDTVNRAARIEAAGAPMRILASERFATALTAAGDTDDSEIAFATHKTIAAKGIEGGIPTVWLDRRAAAGAAAAAIARPSKFSTDPSPITVAQSSSEPVSNPPLRPAPSPAILSE
jgi:class 3 adenylate cyclase